MISIVIRSNHKIIIIENKIVLNDINLLIYHIIGFFRLQLSRSSIHHFPKPSILNSALNNFVSMLNPPINTCKSRTIKSSNNDFQGSCVRQYFRSIRVSLKVCTIEYFTKFITLGCVISYTLKPLSQTSDQQLNNSLLL